MAEYGNVGHTISYYLKGIVIMSNCVCMISLCNSLSSGREREIYVILTKGRAFWVNVCVGSFFLNCTRTKDMMPRGVGWDVARVHMWEQGEKKRVPG